MTSQILVSVESNDRVEDIIPQIEQVARPGSKVTFLMRYPVDSGAWLRDHWINSESVKDAMSAGRRLLETYSCDAQSQLADQRVLLARNILPRMGVEVAVDVYTGPFDTAVEKYNRPEDMPLVLRPKRVPPMTRLMHKIFAFLGSFKKNSSPQILHPSR